MLHFIFQNFKMWDKKSGQFCKTKCAAKKKNIGSADHRRWIAYNNSGTLDTVAHDHEYIETVETSSAGEEINITDPVGHDHDYLPSSVDVLAGVEIYEEEISTTKALPKTAVPTDKYRLVVELSHKMNQLKTGCTQWSLQLNLCKAEAVLHMD